MATPSSTNDSEPLQAYHVGSLLRPAPLMAPATTCGAIAESFISNPSLQAIVVPLEGDRFGLVARASYLPEYLEGWNRDLFQRKPVTQLMEHDPLVVPEDTPVDQVAMLVSSKRPQVLKSGFIITRNGAYAGIGIGLDLLRAVALRAQQASAAKSTFLAHMSHEIRTPLNAVIGNLELLSETPLDGDQSDLARIARVSAQTLIEIIGDLLDLSKIEADRFELEVVDTDIRRIVEEARTIMIPRARAKGLRLEAHVGARVPAIVRTDPLRLRQVLINFAGNACKFTVTGGVFFNVSREEERDENGRVCLRFEVVDTGPGFDPRRAAALFEPYVQEAASTARLYGGTGLGLAISKRIVDMQGGAIGSSTEPGLGSTFWCTIPMPVVVESPECPVSTIGEVLCVGAQGAVRENLVTWMEQYGASVTCAADAQEAGRISVTRDPYPHILQLVTEPAEANAPVGTLDSSLGIVSASSHSMVAATKGTRLIMLSDSTLPESPLLRYRAYSHGASLVLRFPQQLEDLRQVLSARDTRHAETQEQARTREPIRIPSDFLPVLVIDDAETNRALAERQLARLGFPFDSAENGLEGLRKATSRDYSLILVDSSMPVMDGPTFAQRFREFEINNGRPHVPVIAMTAHALRGDADRLLGLGMDAYLPKPVTLERLEVVLRTWLGSKLLPQAAAIPSKEPSSESAIDLLRLKQLLGPEDATATTELLTLFASELPKLLEPVARALAARDRNALAHAVHAAKGAAGGAAARRLWELLAAMEGDARVCTFAELASGFELIQAESVRVQAHVAKLCSSSGN